MDNFKIIYKILRYLESTMDYDEIDADMFRANHFKVSEERWVRLLEMLTISGYIDGLTVKRSMNGNAMMNITLPRITLKGLEYLQENSLMQKAERLVKGISDIIPH